MGCVGGGWGVERVWVDEVLENECVEGMSKLPVIREENFDKNISSTIMNHYFLFNEFYFRLSKK